MNPWTRLDWPAAAAVRARRARRVAVLLWVTCAFVLAVGATTASATFIPPRDEPLAGSTFQGGDGNEYDPVDGVGDPVDVDGDGKLDYDWQHIASQFDNPDNVTYATTDDPAPSDSCFGSPNQKQLAPDGWVYITCGTGVNPAADNLLAGWSYVDQTTGDTYLNLSFHREVQAGNTYLAFERTKDTTPSHNSQGYDVPCRRGDGIGPLPDDLLISYQIASGGSPPNVELVVHRWQTITADETTGCAKTGTVVDAAPPAPLAEAALNGTSITNYIDVPKNGSSFAEGTFGEASINLTAFYKDLLDANPCFSFGQVSMETHSSTSFTSDLKDFMGPTPLVARSCTASGTKFHDQNANGVRDADEPGLAGWRIYADINGDNDWDQTTETPNQDLDGDGVKGEQAEPSALTVADDPKTANVDETGNYVISNMPAGSYQIREVQQNGWVCSAPATIDATAPGCKREWNVTYTGSENKPGLDFGNYHNGSISGHKYEDLNADGAKNGNDGDNPLAGFTFFADLDHSGTHDAGEPESNVTGSDGAWTISDLKPGDYSVVEEPKTDWTATSGPFSVTVTSGNDMTTDNSDPAVDLDFLNWTPGTISGLKYGDTDANGTQNNGETGLAGFTFYVDDHAPTGYDAGDSQDVSDADGKWTIEGVTPGAYIVRELAPDASWHCSQPVPCNYHVTVQSGRDAKTDSSTDHVALTFGNYQNGSISGHKYEDLNADGKKNGNDADNPLAGFRFYADLDNSGVHETGEPLSNTTGTDGAWTIGNLKPGTYTVRELPKAGWTVTSGPFTVIVTSGHQSTTDDSQNLLDFLNWAPGSISGHKYEDLNADGTKDGADSSNPLAGFRFFADLNHNGDLDANEPESNVTLADGAWKISGLAPGTYSVVEEPKAGWTATSGPFTVVVQSGRDSTTDNSNPAALLDFLNWTPGTISGLKYGDTDASGTQNNDETGLAVFTFYIDDHAPAGYDAGDSQA